MFVLLRVTQVLVFSHEPFFPYLCKEINEPDILKHGHGVWNVSRIDQHPTWFQGSLPLIKDHSAS
ncbi:hypothetical protein [Pontibacter anaerobius]|uniref:Uncharacterized protein n=1 Tax=Pontibacter anaerobius TaxID=2993940 RepID=A0ABT3RGL2_9BACT|nr:hypothetical protein [Pontibacter anaerobius]MCX2740900.1 hypothetical protein [Pontibacter anaerobius]